MSLVRRIVLTALVLGISIAAYAPIYPELPVNEIDPSWMLGMNQAMAQGLVFGRDIVFTFGPYSVLYTQAYHPATYGLALASGVIFGLGNAALMLMAFKREQLPWLLAYTGFLLLIDSRDALFFAYPLLVMLLVYKATLPATDPRHVNLMASTSKSVAFLLCIALLGLLPIVKASFMPLALAACLSGLALFWHPSQRRYALLFVVLPLSTLVVSWRIAGQPIDALPDYFQSLWPIISGYTDAMATYPDGSTWPALKAVLPAMLVLFLGTAALTLIATHRSCRTPAFGAAVLMLFLVLFYFIAFKASFVRRDQHTLAAGSALLLMIFALRMFNLAQPGRVVTGLALSTWLIIHSFYMPGTLQGSPIYSVYKALSGDRMGSALPEAYARELQAIRDEYPIPPLQGSADIYPYDVAALIASGNRWTPRPILQSYSVYTPSLSRLNANYLHGPEAPDNIVFRTASIDLHYPGLEDGLSWLTLLSHYTVTDTDPHFIYFKRQNQPVQMHRKLLLEGRFEVGDSVDIPPAAGTLFAELELQPTLLGRIVNLAFKTSLVSITVELADGQSHNHRLVPGMARTGFILSPLIQSNADLVTLAQGKWQALESGAVKRLRIATADGGALYWQPNYTLRLTALRAGTELAESTQQAADLTSPTGTSLALQEAP